MPYLFTLPGLLCGLALSIEDVRHRRVPIAWVAAGALLQLAADFAYGVVVNDLFVLLQALLFTVLCCLIQFALALLVPRSLGFGDVTALIPMGLSVGLFGLLPVVGWRWALPASHGLPCGRDSTHNAHHRHMRARCRMCR